MSKISSEMIPTDIHNSPMLYSTVSHEKNILVKNKGQHINPLTKPLSLHYVPDTSLSPNVQSQELKLSRKFGSNGRVDALLHVESADEGGGVERRHCDGRGKRVHFPR